MDAASLIASAHGKLLRLLAEDAGRHFEGLSQAARFHKALPNAVRRRITQLDIAHNYIRHVTQPLVLAFHEDVKCHLAGRAPGADSEASTDTDAAASLESLRCASSSPPSESVRSPSAPAQSGLSPRAPLLGSRDLLKEGECAFFDIFDRADHPQRLDGVAQTEVTLSTHAIVQDPAEMLSYAVQCLPPAETLSYTHGMVSAALDARMASAASRLQCLSIQLRLAGMDVPPAPCSKASSFEDSAASSVACALPAPGGAGEAQQAGPTQLACELSPPGEADALCEPLAFQVHAALCHVAGASRRRGESVLVPIEVVDGLFYCWEGLATALGYLEAFDERMFKGCTSLSSPQWRSGDETSSSDAPTAHGP